MYKDTPRYPLLGRGIAAESFVDGPLENWTAGALELDGQQQYLTVAHEKLVAPFATEVKIGRNTLNRAWAGDQKRTVDMQDNSFLLEAYLKTSDSDGIIARKVGRAGYSLEVLGGKLVLRLVQGGNDALTVTGPAIADGGFHHVVAEVDRENGVKLYVDGSQADASSEGTMPAGSLSNNGDFLVGGGPDGEGLAATLEFLRVSRGTLADARTSIEELYAWQFDGPQFRDFAGKTRGEKPDAGALEQ
jgi:hypothetical protein